MAPAADREGYWGPPTSTLEWCEENYAVSYYIAEFCEWPLRPRLLPRPRGPRPAAASFSLSAALRVLSPRRGNPSSSLAPLSCGVTVPLPLSQPWWVEMGCFLSPSPTNPCRKDGVVQPLCSQRVVWAPMPSVSLRPVSTGMAGLERGAGGLRGCLGWGDPWGVSRELGWLCGTAGVGGERGFRWSRAWGATP